MQRLIFLFALSIICFSVNGQNALSKLIHQFEIPAGWHSDITYDTSYFPLFQQRQVARWDLESSRKNQKVTFYIYDYSKKDSSLLVKKMLKYYMFSSCINFSSAVPGENFTSFDKGKYFFVMEACPCSTAQDPVCRILAKKLFAWINSK